MGITSKEFGTVPMAEEIATPEDIAYVVKGVTSMPLKSADGDVVQLIGSQSGYQTGSFYQYRESENKWIKVEKSEWQGAVPSYPILAVLEEIDDHTCLVLDTDGRSLVVEDFCRLIFQSEEGEVVLGQFDQLSFSEYRMTLPKPLEFYERGKFICRVFKNNFTVDLELVV